MTSKMVKTRLVKGRANARAMAKKAGLTSWRNSKTKLTPSAVAASYAQCVLNGHLLSTAKRCLELFKDDPCAAKRLFEHAVPDFGDAQLYRHWRQFGALFLKSWGSAEPGEARRARTTASFEQGEQRCRRYNRKLRWFKQRPNRMPENIRVVLSRAREIIHHHLGEFTPERLRDLVERGYAGKGVAIGTRCRDAVSLPFKLGHTDLCCTPAALPYARALVESSWVWCQSAGHEGEDGTVRLEYRLVEGNRVAFVAKDSIKDRSIAIEPSLNVMLQLGVHSFLAERVLPRMGVRLESQHLNRQAAMLGGSRWEDLHSYVTLDLANSSNTLSCGFIEMMIPDNGWLGYLRDLRSPRYQLAGGSYTDYEMWSSMGNGYTFVLQCLIYMALARAAGSLCETELQPRVYGDDIAVDRGCAALLIEVLQWCGMEVNTSKSYLFGPFRESCGLDVLGGSVVTPVYLRGCKSLRNTDVFRLVNGFYGRSSVCERHARFREWLIESLPRDELVHVPMGAPTTSGIWTYVQSRDWWWHKWEQRYYYLGVVWRGVTARHIPLWSYAAALMGADRSCFLDGLSVSNLRGRGQYVLVASPTTGWGCEG